MPDDSVRAVYVILTHDDWPQVERLIRAIRSSSPRSHVLVAHDARVTPFPTSVADPDVEIFSHGLDTDWGSWELVEATLLAFARARDRFDPDLVCLISGRDYPVRRIGVTDAASGSLEVQGLFTVPVEELRRVNRAPLADAFGPIVGH